MLLAPVAWLPWYLAHAVWLILTVLSFGLAVASLASLLGLDWKERRTYLFLALALALAPFHTGMAAGSIVIVVVALCAFATLAANRAWKVAAGVVLAVAVGLKPQIGLPFLAFYVLRKRWRLATISLAVLVILSAVAIFFLKLNHAPWLENYKYDNRVLFAHGSLGDFTEANPIRFSLVNLQVLLYTFTANRTTANVMAFVIALVLGALWLVLFLQDRGHGDDELVQLSALTVLSLLPVYHRLYDASLLIFPLAWSVANLSTSRNRITKLIFFLILAFLVPGGSVLEVMQRTGHFIALQHSWFWSRFVMPHQVWVLVALSCLLLSAMRHSALHAARSATED